MAVFVLDKRKQPLMPCSEKRARQLLDCGRAVVHKMYPFTIRIRDRKGGAVQPIEIRIDPGSKSTGIAVIRKDRGADRVLHLVQQDHRGAKISASLEQRSGFRRRRRSANLRYRKPRFDNRRKSEGWLAPSLRHRIEGTVAYAKKLSRILPAFTIAQELVRFDLQKLESKRYGVPLCVEA